VFDAAELLELIPPADRVAAALVLIDAEIDVDQAALSDGAMDERVLGSLALADRARALAMLTVGAWEPRQTWKPSNARSARSWLAHHGDLGTAGAGRVLRAGRIVFEFDHIAKRVRSGELSAGRVDLIAAAVTPERRELFARDETTIAEHATNLRHDAAAMMMRRWAMLADDALANHDHAEQRHRRRCHLSRVGNQWRLDGTFDLADGAIIAAALKDAMDDPDPLDTPGGPRTCEQRRADGLTKIASQFLRDRNRGCGANPVATVAVHIDAATLLGDSADGFDPDAICDLTPGGPVPRDVARMILCDSLVGRVILGADAEVLDHGRLKRLFTPAQKRAMIARDGPTCVVPGCTVPVEECQAHTSATTPTAGSPTSPTAGTSAPATTTTSTSAAPTSSAVPTAGSTPHPTASRTTTQARPRPNTDQRAPDHLPGCVKGAGSIGSLGIATHGGAGTAGLPSKPDAVVGPVSGRRRRAPRRLRPGRARGPPCRRWRTCGSRSGRGPSRPT
jgi:hypothetical protein